MQRGEGGREGGGANVLGMTAACQRAMGQRLRSSTVIPVSSSSSRTAAVLKPSPFSTIPPGKTQILLYVPVFPLFARCVTNCKKDVDRYKKRRLKHGSEVIRVKRPCQCQCQ